MSLALAREGQATRKTLKIRYPIYQVFTFASAGCRLLVNHGQSDRIGAIHTQARKRTRAEAKKRYAKLIRRREASQYLLEVHGLQFAPDTLAKFACEGTGPEIHFVNKIPFYRPTGLDTWAKAKISKPTRQAKKDPYHRNRRQARPPTEPVVAA